MNDVGMQPVIVLGAGGNSLDLLETLRALQQLGRGPSLHCIGILDDDAAKWGSRIDDVEVLGGLERASDYPQAVFASALGSTRNYWRKAEILARTGVQRTRFITVIDPTASVSPSAQLGVGSLILQNATVTARARIGDHVMVLPNSIVSHHAEVGDYSTIAGGVCISGNVRVGQHCYLGSNCTIRNGLLLGDGCLIGMGSVVLQDVPPGAVVAGNPARLLRQGHVTESTNKTEESVASE